MEDMPTKWMKVMDPSNPENIYVVQVIIDRCADKNFIPHHLAKDFNLIISEDNLEHAGLSGDTFTTERSAKVSMIGKKNRTMTCKFCVLPETQTMVQMVVGRESINELDELLLDEAPTPRPAYYTAQKKTTVGTRRV